MQILQGIGKLQEVFRLIDIKRNNRRKGFTLVEILVVVVVLGLLASLVVPRIVGRGEEAKGLLP